jgi:hypothetical protein
VWALFNRLGRTVYKTAEQDIDLRDPLYALNRKPYSPLIAEESWVAA